MQEEGGSGLCEMRFYYKKNHTLNFILTSLGNLNKFHKTIFINYLEMTRFLGGFINETRYRRYSKYRLDFGINVEDRIGRKTNRTKE